MDMNDLFAPEPLHRHVMLSASAEKHCECHLNFTVQRCEMAQGTNRCSRQGRPDNS